MKKILALILILAMLIPFAGCSEKEETVKVPESLKILAVGNSFSVDAVEYLYQMLEEAGVKEIVIGNLYYAGCSLEQHLDFALNDSPVYNYHKNDDGTWGTTHDFILCDALFDEEWDYITFQETSKTCGLRESYVSLDGLLDYVEELDTGATMVWHMTWAYQQDSDHKSFPNYDNSQQKMYDMIIDCVKNCIEPEKRLTSVIPCMTSIQNARTSFMGDTLTRDGYHLDKGIGRYIAALTWCCFFTGVSPDAITHNPRPEVINDDMIAAARDAVKNALKTPYSVTRSAVKEGTDVRLTITEE